MQRHTSSFSRKFSSLLISYYIKCHIFFRRRPNCLSLFVPISLPFLFLFYSSPRKLSSSPKGIFFIENKPSESIKACSVVSRVDPIKICIYTIVCMACRRDRLYMSDCTLTKCVGRNALRMTDSHETFFRTLCEEWILPFRPSPFLSIHKMIS